jgi:DNA-binding NarL/FixJ family response regulator
VRETHLGPGSKQIRQSIPSSHNPHPATPLANHKPFFTSMATEVMLTLFQRPSAFLPAGVRNRRLTSREREVVQLLSEGRSSKEVASSLGISVKTAETHRANIMRKLEIHSVIELVRYAVRNQIIEA